MKLLAALALALALTGCSRNFFIAKGKTGSEGPAFDQWASTPQGCSRAPIDGLPQGRTSTLATFYWEDPAIYTESLRNHGTAHTPDRPDQLSLLRAPAGGYNLRLKTVETFGTLIVPQDCTTLDIETHEQPPALPGARPALAGTVHFSCTVKQSHVWADFTFSRCEF